MVSSFFIFHNVHSKMLKTLHSDANVSSGSGRWPSVRTICSVTYEIHLSIQPISVWLCIYRNRLQRLKTFVLYISATYEAKVCANLCICPLYFLQVSIKYFHSAWPVASLVWVCCIIPCNLFWLLFDQSEQEGT